MIKLFNYLKNKYANWQLERQLHKEIDTTTVKLFDVFETFREEQEAVKGLYVEGLAKIKKKVGVEKNQVKFLEKTNDLFNLAEGDNLLVKEQVEQLKEVFIFKKEKSKEQMIEDRIKMYYKLQSYNKERQLIRAIKTARKEGNEELAGKLEREWRTAYRSSKEN